MPIIVPRRAMTLEGYVEWAASEDFPETGSISYIDGQVYIDMSPANVNSHQFLLGEVGRVLQNLVAELDLGEFYPDRSLLTNKDVELSTEPDAAFASWATLESGRLVHAPAVKGGPLFHIVGSPDWVLEVMSPTSRRKDSRILREKYHEAGIAEYWLIDATGEEIDFQLLLHGPTGYSPVAPVGGWLASKVFPRQFRLTREHNRAGNWRYTLHTRQ